MEHDFEAAFSRYLDHEDYDQAENALFNMMRMAFKAGWCAAGGSLHTDMGECDIGRQGQRKTPQAAKR